MRTLWRKAVRDLAGEPLRSAAVVAALALGIAAFLAVLSAHPILTRALNVGYAESRPAAATLWVPGLDPATVAAVAGMDQVEAAEARRTVRGRIRAGAEWRDLLLFVRDDLAASRIGVLVPQTGSWPPGPAEVAIERDALQVARCAVGDTVTVRLPSGGTGSLRVTGSVHDVAQPQARMENTVYGYLTVETLAALGEPAAFDELVIRVAGNPMDELQIRAVADAVAAEVQRRGHTVARIDVPEPGQHPHARLMGMLTLSVAVFGLFLLALSGVIVLNVLTALLAGQRRQIAVMKALGGSRRQIASVYLTEAVLYGVAGLALAVPAGVACGRLVCRWLAGLLNFDLPSYALPAWLYALVAAVGLGVPALAAAIPVARGLAVPVREGLGAAVGEAFGGSAVDRALARVGGVSRIWLLAARNTARNRGRTALTVATLTVAGVFFLSAVNVRTSLQAMADRSFELSRADLTVTLAADAPAEAVELAVGEIAGVTVAEGWIEAAGALPTAGPATTRDQLKVTAMPPGSRMLALDLSAGGPLDADPRSVVVNSALHQRLGGPEVGAPVRVRIAGTDAELRLVGVADEPFSGPGLYLSRAYFDRGPRAGAANSVRVALSSADQAAVDQARAAIEDRLGSTVVQTRSRAELRKVLDEHFVIVFVFLLVVSAVLGGVGGLGVLTTVSLNVAQRRREIAVLRAIGATPARIIQIVAVEAATVGALAWLGSVVAVAPAAPQIARLMLRLLLQFDPDVAVRLEPVGLAVWLAVATLGSALASWLPTQQALRVSVRAALSYE